MCANTESGLKLAVIAAALAITCVQARAGEPCTETRQLVVKTARAVIDWPDLPADVNIEIKLPTAKSAVLYRVSSSQALELRCKITSNGVIAIAAPAGISVAVGAEIMTRGLTLSARELDVKKYKAGQIFYAQGQAAGNVQFAGRAQVDGPVMLVGDRVIHEGVIVVGARQVVGIEARSLELAPESAIAAESSDKPGVGGIVITSQDDLVLAGQIIAASGGLVLESGGSITQQSPVSAGFVAAKAGGDLVLDHAENKIALITDISAGGKLKWTQVSRQECI